MLSQTAEYALRTVLYLAEHSGDQPVRATQLAQALKVPRNYLSKTLHLLAREGILASSRGKTGGFRLARPPEDITVLDVIGPFDRIEQRRECLLGRPTCSDATPCAAHARWKDVSAQLSAFFRDTTIGDLIGTGRVSSGRAVASSGQPTRPR
ncbi:MAG: RrF2 family transcriptional regulator [Gemmatimonadota bacterium]